MYYSADLVPIPEVDPVPELILHDREVVEVVVHLVRELALVPHPDDPLFRQVGRCPEDLECDLVSADEGLLTRGVLVEEEVDRKSTRLNSSHVAISYAVFCLMTRNQLPCYMCDRSDSCISANPDT